MTSLLYQRQLIYLNQYTGGIMICFDVELILSPSIDIKLQFSQSNAILLYQYYGSAHLCSNVDFNTVTYNCWDDNLSDQGYERAIEMTPKMEAALEWLQSLGSELAKFKTRVNSYNS
jgi:hypothetical protein